MFFRTIISHHSNFFRNVFIICNNSTTIAETAEIFGWIEAKATYVPMCPHFFPLIKLHEVVRNPQQL